MAGVPPFLFPSPAPHPGDQYGVEERDARRLPGQEDDDQDSSQPTCFCSFSSGRLRHHPRGQSHSSAEKTEIRCCLGTQELLLKPGARGPSSVQAACGAPVLRPWQSSQIKPSASSGFAGEKQRDNYHGEQSITPGMAGEQGSRQASAV